MLPFHSAGRNTDELSTRRIHAILPSQTAAVQFLMNRKDGTVTHATCTATAMRYV